MLSERLLQRRQKAGAVSAGPEPSQLSLALEAAGQHLQAADGEIAAAAIRRKSDGRNGQQAGCDRDFQKLRFHDLNSLMSEGWSLASATHLIRGHPNLSECGWWHKRSRIGAHTTLSEDDRRFAGWRGCRQHYTDHATHASAGRHPLASMCTAIAIA